MKKLLFTFLFFVALKADAQHKLTQIWKSADSIPVPESVYYAAKEKLLYVSQIDGGGSEKDGKGAIGKLALDGKTINLNWVTGLNAPKGIGVYKNTMYVADLTEVVVIDMKNAKITKRIEVPETEFLNDVTVDDKGVVYVSDTRKRKVFRIVNNVPELYLSDIKSANGLKAIGTDLYILAGPELWKANAKKELTKLAEGLELGGDGLEPVKDGEFLVSCWGGLIYYVTTSGKVEKLLDTRAEKINTADIGYDPVKRIVYVPTFLKNSVLAFQLD